MNREEAMSIYQKALDRLADRQEAAVGRIEGDEPGKYQDSAANRAIVSGLDLEMSLVEDLMKESAMAGLRALAEQRAAPAQVIGGQWMHGFHFGVTLMAVLEEEGLR